MPGAHGDGFTDAVCGALTEGVTLRTDQDLTAGREARVLVRGLPSEEQLAACPRLERLVIPYAGLPERTRALMLERPGATVHNLHHNASPTAELAVALLMAVAKDVLALDRALRDGDWRPRHAPTRAVTLAGRTALVLGYGAIGRRIAHALDALGLHVAAIRRRVREALHQGIEVHGRDALERLLPRASVVMVALPDTGETRGILGPNELACLPPGAYLVNVGRATLVDEDALYEALRSKRLAGAGIDVWYRYPEDEDARANTLPSRRAFHELDNVVLSPHRGGLTAETERLRGRALARLLNAVAAGGSVPDVVDVRAGY
jgi:phosphoglycerate dehydrogenase-like enzyme